MPIGKKPSFAKRAIQEVIAGKDPGQLLEGDPTDDVDDEDDWEPGEKGYQGDLDDEGLPIDEPGCAEWMEEHFVKLEGVKRCRVKRGLFRNSAVEVLMDNGVAFQFVLHRNYDNDTVKGPNGSRLGFDRPDRDQRRR